MIRSAVLWVAVVLIALYWPLAAVLPPDALGTIMRVIQSSVSFVGLVAYAPTTAMHLRDRVFDRPARLSLGITLGFLAMFSNGFWFLLWRLAHRPPWMPDSWVNGFTLWLAAVAVLLHISAAEVPRDKPDRVALLVMGAFAAGVLTAAILLLVVPDVRGFVEALRPYLHL